MKRIFYYTTTALIVSCGITQAQTCVPTPTCSTLGYTSTTACDGGIKCPFGEAWNCSTNEIKTEITEKITELTNKITEQTNKITEIEQKVVVNQSQGEVCVIGSILYSDKSCYLNPQKGKTPIGIVVYIDGAGGGQAMALKSIGSYEWSSEYVDISTLPNYGSNSAAKCNSCGNTAKIIAAGNKRTYQAAWAAHEYSTEGTSAGDWCLPAAGIFTSYYNNQTAINSGFEKVGGTTFDSTYAWSSSETDYGGSAWHLSFSDSYGLDWRSESYSYEVRPVLEFQVLKK